MEKLKLIICYHCHALADHIKPKCPYIKEPQFCSKCGLRGHPAWSCQNSAYCLQCGGDHPANSRICPVYQLKFADTLRKAMEQSRDLDSDHDLLVSSTPSQKLQQSLTEPMTILTEAITTSINSASSPTDFLSALYTSLKESSPTKKIPAPSTHDTDRDLHPIHSDPILTSDEEERVERTVDVLATHDAPLTINPVSESTDDDEDEAPTCQKLIRAPLLQFSPLSTKHENEDNKFTVNNHKLKGANRPEKEQADAEEYVLPADESEWTRLFDVLRLRLVTTELSEQEISEGEGLLPYQDVISFLPPTEQVPIFQELCLLTNTAIQTAD